MDNKSPTIKTIMAKFNCSECETQSHHKISDFQLLKEKNFEIDCLNRLYFFSAKICYINLLQKR